MAARQEGRERAEAAAAHSPTDPAEDRARQLPQALANADARMSAAHRDAHLEIASQSGPAALRDERDRLAQRADEPADAEHAAHLVHQVRAVGLAELALHHTLDDDPRRPARDP